MFSQKKRQYKAWIWPAIALVATSCCILLLIGYMGLEDDPLYTEANGKKDVYEEQTGEMVENEDESFAEKDGSEIQLESEEEFDTAIEGIFESYYIVKYDKDVIRIYFSDQTGKITELEETTIVYETLSTEDQERFVAGVKLETRDDLNKLLMDYES